jgi:hypothetical protein
MYDNLLALTLKLKQVVSKEPCFQNNPDITVTTLTCLETDQQVKQDDTNDTTDKEFDIFDLSPLSQISEEETEAHDMTSENNNKREESAKKTASSDDEDLNHAKRRKLSAVMGQGSDGNGFKSNGFSDMDDDKEHSHRDDDEQVNHGINKAIRVVSDFILDSRRQIQIHGTANGAPLSMKHTSQHAASVINIEEVNIFQDYHKAMTQTRLKKYINNRPIKRDH